MLVPTTQLIFWAGMLVPFALGGALSRGAAGLGWCYLAGLIVAAVLDGALAVARRKRIRMDLPSVVRLARNRKGSIPLHLHIGLPRPSHVRVGLALPASVQTETDYLDIEVPLEGEQVSVVWECIALCRGRYPLERAYSEVTSPLGLWRVRTISECACELRVYPNLSQDRARVAALFLNRGGFGMHAQRVVGQGREFERLRDYIPGDGYGDIHWKATARRGHPVTKLFQVERTQEIVVAVDTSRLTGRLLDGEPLLERFLTTALVLGQVAQNQGDLFGVATFNSKVHSFVRPGTGHAHYGVCRDALYTVEPERVTPDFGELFAFVRQRMRRRSLVLILTDLSDAMIAESFYENVKLISRHHLVLVAMIRPRSAVPMFEGPPLQSTDEIYEHVGGHLRWQKLREVQQQLHRQGVTMQLVDEERLTNEVVTQYMKIKARQAL